MRLQTSIGRTPFEVAETFHNEPDFVFLDSARIDAAHGRRSILGWRASTVLRTSGPSGPSGKDPFAPLDRLSADAIGYLSYDLFRYLEKYDGTRNTEDPDLPESWWGQYDVLCIFDHVDNEWTVEGGSEGSIRRRVEEIRSRPNLPRTKLGGRSVGALESNMSRRQYMDAVKTVLDRIGAGDIYQANIAQRFTATFDADPFDLFAALRDLSPSTYSAYLNCGDHVVISSSPELFLSRDRDSIETRPIKGTRPRGQTPEEDQKLERDLWESEKERAELAMIVDLERNDLGRICEYGSVAVTQPRYIEKLPTVFHTAAVVRGKLRPRLTPSDILRATFPGGSISGCPKIRAIEIIDQLEPSPRHVYTGAIGRIAADGDLTLSIAIRTMVVANGRVYFHVGSGIVADSDPALEYEETLVKAAAMKAAIARVVSDETERQTPRATN